jgi:hypothetical protein
LLLLLGNALLLPACSDEKNGNAGQCRPDVKLIAEQRVCRADDQCPCGAHCELGKCMAECTANGDCQDGARCDSFGRCRSASDSGKLLPLSGAGSGHLSTVTSSLVVPQGDSGTFLLTAEDGDAEAVRLQASEGFELECDDGAWQGECVDAGVQQGEARARKVRRQKGAKVASGTVEVFHGSRVISVSLTSDELPALQPLAGTYLGAASLVATAVGDGAALDSATGISGVAVPIKAEVFDNGVVRLTDPLYGLSPEGQLIGKLDLDDELAGAVSVPRLALDRTSLTRSLSTDLLGSFAGASFSRAGGSLTLSLPLAFEGLWPGESVPRASWVVSLERSGDLGVGTRAPGLPDDAEPALDAAAASEPSDWAQAVKADFAPWSVASPADQLQQLLFSWQATSGTDRSAPRRLDACSESGRSVVAKVAAADEWRAVTFAPQTYAAPASIPKDVQSGKNALLGVALGVASAKYVKSAVVTQAVTATSEGAVPCAVDFEPGPVYCFDGLANTADLQLASVDRCDEIAEELQCDVQAGNGSFQFELQLNTSGSLNSTSCLDSSTHVTGAISKVCVLPTVSWNCGQLVSCAQPDGRTSYSPGSDATSLLTIGGDLMCGDELNALGSTADLRRNQPGNTDTPAQVVENALEDLSLLRSAPVTPWPSVQALDAPRLLVALEYATEADRARGADPTLARSPKATRYALRLLQQWLGTHALIAHEASQHWQVPDSVAGVVPDPLFPSADEALSRSLDGWALLFHPRFAQALAGMAGAELAAPDYRADWLAQVPENPNNQQPEGLPIAIFNGIEAQLELLDVILDEAWPKQDESALVLTGRTLRSAVLAQTLARELHARAVAASDTLPLWEDAYLRADNSASTRLRRVLGRATAMQAGENPLGIEGIDLPLYFYGDDADPAARFSAISDYLLGNGADGDGGGWASILVAQASDAAEGVGAAYTTQVTRQYQAALSQTGTQNRLDDVRLHWGDLVTNLCGIPDGLTTLDVLEKWDNFSAHTCYFASDRADCEVDTSVADSQLDEQTVLYHLCVAGEIQRATGVSIYQNPGLNQIVRQTRVIPLIDCNWSPSSCLLKHPGSASDYLGCVKCGDNVSDFISTSSLAALDLSRTSPDQLRSARATCSRQFPQALQTLPGLDQGTSNPLARADCYRGTLGDAAFSVLGAQKDLEIARSQYSEHLDGYELEMNGCLIKTEANQILDDQRLQFNSAIKGLRESKAEWDETAAIACGVKDCAVASTLGAGLSGPSLGAAAAASAVACGAAIAESVAKVGSIKAQLAIDNAQDVFDDFSAKLAEQTDVKLCMNEAHQQLIGLRTANQQIDRALLDLAQAQSTLTGGVGSAQLAYDQGRAALATARARSLRPPALDAWVDQDIDTFIGLMHQAKRVTYLAERAVEYEYQASLSARQDILTAATPDQLAAVLSDLKSTSGTRGISGHRPSSLKIVLSLREHLMQLFDARKVKSGEQNLSDVERFRLLLGDRRFAVYEDGKYAGQRIPFSLTPLQALGGDTKGISIFGATDCAERLWSVNASILGGGDLQRGSDASSFARVDLLKANTFFSQWCGSDADDPFQVASVRPSRNLFRDPEFGLSGAISPGGGGGQNEISLFSRARIQAYFNVARNELESDDFANGDTSELAARGLFGDYALFFPAGVLSLASADARGAVSYSDGLNLGAIDDILLRLDYVSVAR